MIKLKLKSILSKCAIILITFIFAQNLSAKWAEPNEKAPQGGTFNYNLDAEPELLHPIMSTDLYAKYVADYGHGYLCTPDFGTWEFKPFLAERWDISKDGLVFTFFLRKNAFFHNGEPVTADDVKFSFDAIREPKHEALHMLPYLDKISKIEVLDKHTIKFTASEKYFQNINSICYLAKIIPKSVYGDVNKSIKLQKTFVGSGPYKLEKYDKGQILVLKKFDKWFGTGLPEFKGKFNFDQVNIRFTKDDTVKVERLKKGEIDYQFYHTTDGFLKAAGKPFKPKKDHGSYITVAIDNEMPKNYGFVGLNMKDKILSSKNVRLALAHLTNREEMNKKFYENLNNLAIGPVHAKSAQAPDRKPIEFNPKKAQELLTKEGWIDSDKNGVLDKVINGTKTELKLSFIYARKESEKQWTIVKEDFKKAGIEIDLKLLEWNSFIKQVHENNTQMFAMAWGAGDVESDPKQIWHSSSSKPGGSNYINYNNPEVDKLIDQGRGELDSKKRTEIFKKAYTLIADDVPYIFLFNKKYETYAMSKKVKNTGDSFRYDLGHLTWWAQAL